MDFTSGNTAGAGGFNGGPLVNYVTDNTKKQTLNLKGDYKIDKQWTGTVGYVPEQYDYADDQMRGLPGLLSLLPEPGRDQYIPGFPAPSRTRATRCNVI